ncbi:MAG TPA: redoxin domain-containing protein [Candidatus Limnocylindria bacterium]|nr:redoxin domain-containing protein [Candidatus Limnocylindria bacterium]
MELRVGDKAPEFELEDQNGKKVKLSDYRGKKVLLSWHPFAYTGVCTDQMRALEVNADRLAKHNTVALGISVDPAPAKKAWAAMLPMRKTPILADFYPHGKVSKDYGTFFEDTGASGRLNVLVDEQGNIEWMKVYERSTLPDIEDVFRHLESEEGKPGRDAGADTARAQVSDTGGINIED